MKGRIGLRWVIGAAAWVALSLAVWFAGDGLSLGGAYPLEGAGARVALAIAAGESSLAWVQLRARRALRQKQRLHAGLSAGANLQS